jgi:hypothetical protein
VSTAKPGEDDPRQRQAAADGIHRAVRATQILRRRRGVCGIRGEGKSIRLHTASFSKSGASEVRRAADRGTAQHRRGTLIALTEAQEVP